MSRRGGPVPALGVLVVALAIAGACAAPGGAPSAPATASSPTAGSSNPAAVELTVLGASSLRDTLTQTAVRYGLVRPQVRLRLAFDASSALRVQIEQGAPSDVFVSADITNPQALIDHDLAAGPLMTIARNQLVVVVPRSTGAVVASPLDLARRGVKVIAAGPGVPITKYTTELLGRLAGLPGYPTDFATRVAANVVSREDNVRAILAKVALGEGDAGIVYATDARAASVGVIDIPANANVVAAYGAVTTRASTHPAEARMFLDWLAGSDGQAVLADFGFLRPGP